MTKSQTIAHKQGNQKRKAAMLKHYRGMKQEESLKVRMGGVIQDGKFTK